jgi:hypothetical protein
LQPLALGGQRGGILLQLEPLAAHLLPGAPGLFHFENQIATASERVEQSTL